jgi:hypothetical protein
MNISIQLTLAALAALGVVASGSHAATWQYSWTPAAGESTPKAEVCPLKYGKTWAYAVEIDDNPASTLTVSQPLLARYSWNDAPPGVAGGKHRPFVGTAAIVLGGINTGNSTRLSLEQINELKKNGWGIANHSYWHTGNHWDKSKFLKPEEFQRELFWSQALFAHLVGEAVLQHISFFPTAIFITARTSRLMACVAPRVSARLRLATSSIPNSICSTSTATTTTKNTGRSRTTLSMDCRKSRNRAISSLTLRTA